MVGLSPSALSEGVRQAVELQGWKGGGGGRGGSRRAGLGHLPWVGGSP